MTVQRRQRLLALLLRDGGWMTASVLADQLGVTPRSVRSYIAQLNARVPAGDAIESGPSGYRANASVAAPLRLEHGQDTPRDRLYGTVRALLEAPGGIDLYETADRLGVSDATVEADLARVRALLEGSGVRLARSGARIRFDGDELAQRQLMARLAHDEMEEGAFDVRALRSAVGTAVVPEEALGAFTRRLAEELAGLGHYLNDFASADVTLQAAIAADRVARGRTLESAPDGARADVRRVAGVIGPLVSECFGVELGAGDARHLASLVLTRVVAPEGADAGVSLDPATERIVSAAVERAARDYGVDLAQPDFVRRLALHVQNLAHRARERAWSRNPLTGSLKSAYPMIFEIAVSIAGEVAERIGIEIRDDEIAYIAMHVGGMLERNRQAAGALTATLVSPGYYELHDLMRSRVREALGSAVEVTAVETRVDADWAAIGTDLVLTTIQPPVPDERTVRIPPFLGEADLERIGQAAARIRRQRRLARLRAELERYLVPEAFLRPLDGSGGEEGIIRRLSEPLLRAGIIDADYVEGTLERERLSSTAFTDALAVPHALRMTATRTAIAFGIADGSVAWGDGRVQVVALVAFSEAERGAFQTVFEQLVEVFSERDSVQRLLRRGTGYASFLDELAAVIDG